MVSAAVTESEKRRAGSRTCTRAARAGSGAVGVPDHIGPRALVETSPTRRSSGWRVASVTSASPTRSTRVLDGDVVYRGVSQWWITVENGVVTRIEEQYAP